MRIDLRCAARALYKSVKFSNGSVEQYESGPGRDPLFLFWGRRCFGPLAAVAPLAGPDAAGEDKR